MKVKKVLVVDDVICQGFTLEDEVLPWVAGKGASEIYVCVVTLEDDLDMPYSFSRGETIHDGAWKHLYRYLPVDDPQ